jgi:hypothetical protein
MVLMIVFVALTVAVLVFRLNLSRWMGLGVASAL